MDFNLSDKEYREYIDIDDALSRIGGSMPLYKKLLGRFIEGNHYEQLESALQSGDKEDAVRQAHSLKGVSANLSLMKLRTLSAELEQLLKNDEDYSECLSEIKQVFGATADKITEILK